MEILRTYGRLWVDDLEQELPFLQELVGREPDLRFEFANVKAAAIGHLLVIDVPRQDRSKYPGSATVVVSDLDELARQLAEHGGEITVPVAPSVTGRYLYARHASGAEVEYVEWKPEIVRRILGRPDAVVDAAGREDRDPLRKEARP